MSGVTSNRDLAERLFVSENTIKYHLRNILDKLHVSSRAQVIAFAVQHRLGRSRDPVPSRQSHPRWVGSNHPQSHANHPQA